MSSEAGLGGIKRLHWRLLHGPGLCCSAIAKHTQIATRDLPKTEQPLRGGGRQLGEGPSDSFPTMNANVSSVSCPFHLALKCTLDKCYLLTQVMEEEEPAQGAAYNFKTQETHITAFSSVPKHGCHS